MKSLKKIIAVCLVFVTLFCVFPATAHADGKGHTYTGDSFWGWLLGSGTPDWLDGVIGFISPDYCEDSPTHFHTANSYLRKTNWLEQVGSLGTFDYECQCQYCGDTFYVNEKRVAEVFQEAYSSYVGETIEPTYSTTIFSPNGILIPLPVSFSGGSITFSDTVEGFPCSTYFKSGSVIDNPTGWVVAPLSVLFSGSEFPLAPVAGAYSLVYDLQLVSCSVYSVSVQSVELTKGESTKSFFRFNSPSYAPILVLKSFDTSHVSFVSGRFYLQCVPFNYDLNTTLDASTRAATFTGDIGIIGDDGQLTKVEGDQIFNETTNNYYNPTTGETSTVTDWYYDYSDRSYHLTTEEGDKVTVTYGDENITVQEGKIS